MLDGIREDVCVGTVLNEELYQIISARLGTFIVAQRLHPPSMVLESSVIVFSLFIPVLLSRSID